MRLGLSFLLLVAGCRKTDDNESANSANVEPPTSCVADIEVCVRFSAEWSQEEADEVCAELDGVEAECPEGELGRCIMDDGREYFLYEMPPLEAADYCAFMQGEWVKPGEEPREE